MPGSAKESIESANGNGGVSVKTDLLSEDDLLVMLDGRSGLAPWKDHDLRNRENLALIQTGWIENAGKRMLKSKFFCLVSFLAWILFLLSIRGDRLVF